MLKYDDIISFIYNIKEEKVSAHGMLCGYL